MGNVGSSFRASQKKSAIDPETGHAISPEQAKRMKSEKDCEAIPQARLAKLNVTRTTQLKKYDKLDAAYTAASYEAAKLRNTGKTAAADKATYDARRLFTARARARKIITDLDTSIDKNDRMLTGIQTVFTSYAETDVLMELSREFQRTEAQYSVSEETAGKMRELMEKMGESIQNAADLSNIMGRDLSPDTGATDVDVEEEWDAFMADQARFDPTADAPVGVGASAPHVPPDVTFNDDDEHYVESERAGLLG